MGSFFLRTISVLFDLNPFLNSMLAAGLKTHSGTWPHSLLGLFRMQPPPRWQFFRAGFSPSSVQPASCVGARSAAHMLMRIPQGILHHMGNLSQWRVGWTTASPILPWSGKPGKHLTGCPEGPSGIKPQPPTAVLTQGCRFTWVFLPFLFHSQAHFPHKLLEHKPFSAFSGAPTTIACKHKSQNREIESILAN